MAKRIAVGILAALLAAGLVGCASRGSDLGTTTEGDLRGAESVEGAGDDFAGTRSAQTAPRATMPTRDGVWDEERLAQARGALQPVFYAFDEHGLDRVAREALASNAAYLRANPELNVIIEGHCDERGTNEYNLALGQRRARSARDYLVQAGVAGHRLTMISYGEERPFAYGHDELAWRQNRRAHFVPRFRDAS